jgi:hypothetical protein
MRARKFGRIVNITSAMVKSPRSQMGLSTSCRTALTALGLNTAVRSGRGPDVDDDVVDWLQRVVTG